MWMKPAIVCLLVLASVFGVSVLTYAATQVHLRPGMSKSRNYRVPLLRQVTTAEYDADWSDKGLKMYPQNSFQWIVSPGETFSLNVAVDDRERGQDAVLTVWDWFNIPVGQLHFDAPANEVIEFIVDGRGVYLLTLDRFDGNRHVSRLVRSFGVVPSNQGCRDLWKTEEFFVGVASFPDRQNWTNPFGHMRPEGLAAFQSAVLEADLTARLGIQVVRLNAGTDWIYRLYESNGVQPYLQLWMEGDLLPQYSHIVEGAWRYPKQEKPVRQHYGEIAKLYGDKALFFEINNETDNRDFWRGTTEEYIENLGWALDEFTEHAPDAIITNGGYTLLEPDMTKEYVEAFRDKLDWISFHTHGPLPECVEIFDKIRQLHNEAGYEDPVYVNTEMGMCAWRLDIEKQQAIVNVEKILYFWAQGNRGVILYNSRDDQGPRLANNYAGWGYLDHFMCPRFSYGTISALIDWYAGASFDSILVEEPGLHVYMFSGNDRWLASVMAPGDDMQSRKTVTVASDATKAYILDPMGNAAPVAEPESVTVKTDAYPVTVVFYGATFVSVDK